MSDITKLLSQELRIKLAAEIKAFRQQKRAVMIVDVNRVERKKRKDDLLFEKEMELINNMEL